MSEVVQIAKIFFMSAVMMCNIEDTYLSQEVQDCCVKYGEEYNICPELLMAIIEAESGGNADVKNGGCKGLMQINEKWHKERMENCGVTNIYDVDGNIHLGADYIAELAEQYKDVAVVLAVYHGESNATTKEPSYYVKSILERSADLERRHGK